MSAIWTLTVDRDPVVVSLVELVVGYGRVIQDSYYFLMLSYPRYLIVWKYALISAALDRTCGLRIRGCAFDVHLVVRNP